MLTSAPWILIHVMAMLHVTILSDHTTARVILALKEMEEIALVYYISQVYDNDVRGSLLLVFNVCEHPALFKCHDNADCLNIVGGYQCHCFMGYTGNGTFCTGT